MRANVSRSIVFAFLAAATPHARASDIRVPADYSTIQAAMNAASNGDRVLVDPGTYYENIDFKGKAITVQSTGGSTSTTIDGGSLDTVVRLVNGETSSSVLDGFHLTNGFGTNTSFPADGGGITCHGGVSPDIRNCTIDGNSAWRGGGVSIDASSPTFEACRIVGNQAGGSAGVLVWSVGAPSSPTFLNCIIEQNHATDVGGAGLHCSFGSALLLNCVLAFNFTSDTDPWEGGGIQQGGSGAVTAVNCVIWGNKAAVGGGIFAFTSPVNLWNCVVRENSVDQITLSAGGTVTATSCDIQGSWTGSGNFDADPLFVDPANDDFHLASGSPCIDAGDDAAPNLPATDIDCDSRIIRLHVDIGADEATLVPIVVGISPSRTRFDVPVTVTISGGAFSYGTGTAVTVGGITASNVVVVDDATITCDFPAGPPGPADVMVTDSLGSGTLAGGFAYTPATTISGEVTPGGSVTVDYLFDPGDGIFAIFGIPPEVSMPTPPFDGTLCVSPFHIAFFVPAWPFPDFTLVGTIPNDPGLIGVDVLLQALVGSGLTAKPRDGSWTNCAVLSIR